MPVVSAASALLPDDLIPLPDYARGHGLTPDQMRDWIRKGRIRAWKVGPHRQSRVLVSASEVDNLLATRMRPVGGGQ